MPVGEDYTTLDSIARTGGIRPSTTWPANEAGSSHGGPGGQIRNRTDHAPCGFHDPDDPDRASMVSSSSSGSIFSEQGCRLGFETGQESAATLLEVLDEIGHPGIGVNFDPANMILYGMGDPVERSSSRAASSRST